MLTTGRQLGKQLAIAGRLAAGRQVGRLVADGQVG
jgi:hypothetical protein